jgi:hypothetical protein
MTADVEVLVGTGEHGHEDAGQADNHEVEGDQDEGDCGTDGGDDQRTGIINEKARRTLRSCGLPIL